MTDDFNLVPADVPASQGSSDFAAVPASTDIPPSAGPTPIKNAIISVATAPDTRMGTYAAIQGDQLQKAQDLVDSKQEYSARLQIANQRQQRQMKQLNNFKAGPSLISNDTAKAVDSAYKNVAAQNIAHDAHTAAELETVRRIQDDLTANKPVEARTTYNLLVGPNGAEQAFAKEAAKQLILAQAAERYHNEGQEQGWGAWAYNQLTSLIPTEYNFSRAGIVPGAGGIKNFFLSGTGLQSQGEAMYSKYKDPADLAKAWAPGGELDMSVRDNSTTLGGYSPQTAEELTHALAFESESDRLWANLWGIADAGTVALPKVGVVPWKLLRSVPGALVRLGARDAAVDTVANAWKSTVEDGVAAASKTSGMSADDIVANMENTAMNPGASTEHAASLSADVHSRIDAATEALKSFPVNNPPSSFTNPEEMLNAYQAQQKEIEANLGSTIKDMKFKYENLSTGEHFDYHPGTVPESGNIVPYIEITSGKKDGGFFSSARSASASATKRGVWSPEIIYDEVTQEYKTIDPEFNILGYHGTADAFDQFDPSFGGRLTDAKSAKLGAFFTNNPDVAWTYAVQAAKDKAITLPEFKAASEEYRATLAEVKRLEDAGAVHDVKLRQQLSNAQDRATAARERYEAVKKETSVTGQNVRPVKIRMRNPLTHDYADELHNGYDEQSYSGIIAKAKAAGHDGVILKNTNDSIGVPPEDYFLPGNEQKLNAFNNHDVYVVFNPEDIKAPWDATRIQRDVSGQYVFKHRVNVSEEGFHTAPLNTPNNQFLNVLRSDARLVDRQAQIKAVTAGQNAEHLKQAFTHAAKNALKGINKEQKKWLDEIIRKGQNENKWLSEGEFRILYERASGSEPTNRVVNAYQQHIVINDMEFKLRNDLEYRKEVAAGRETVSFQTGFGDHTFEGNAKVNNSPSIVPSERVYNVTDHIHYTKDNQLTKEEFDRLVGDGYQLVKTKDSISLPDGTEVSNFLIRKGDFMRRDLDPIQLGYREGGHRLYTGNYFLKQAVEGVQADTGQKFLKNPNVYRTGNNPNNLRAIADALNAAIADFKRGILDPQHYEDNIFSKAMADNPKISLPEGDEFLTAAKNGVFDLTHPIEVVGDREMPAAYATTGSNVSRFIDPEETSASGYYRTTGRLYNSHRGDILRDESGEYAATIDPWEAMNKAIFNISKMSSFESYKNNVVQRFEKTYGKFLKLDNPSEASSFDLLKADVGPNVPADLARRIKAEQSAANRIMRFETGWEKKYRQATHDVARWVLGDATGGPRQLGHDFVYWLGKNNPVAALRGLAFDAKLGLFNVGQLFLQSSTMISTLALHPEGGMKAMSSMMPLFSYTLANGRGDVLDVLAKRSWKIGGFESEQEMKDFFKFVDGTGFLKVGNTHLLINEYGPNRVFGAAGAFDAVRQHGRAFFYAGEQFNRAVASRLAYEDLKKQGLQLGTAAFRERFIGLADDLTFNMTHESSAAFQHGLLSIPTQFWAYNVRMMDAMLGNGFTTAAKLRLLGVQLGLYGAAGVPLAGLLSSYWQQKEGKPLDIDSVLGTLDRGLIDKAIKETTGADVRFGERVGTGTFLTNTIEDLFGVGEYGEKSTADVLGGATYSISKQAFGVLGDAVNYAIAETGGDQGYQITSDNLMKLADNVSTVSNIHKALLAYNYGYYRSATGSIGASGLPPADSFFIALGLGQPQEIHDTSVMYDYLNNKEEVVKEAAKQVRNWRQEAFTNPDKLQENQEKVNAYIKLLPADIRTQVIKQTNNITDKSFYDHIALKFQQEKAQEALNNGQ